MKHQPVIIVKKRAKRHEGHHGGAWKVAYADFVTAMMAFFLVMWIIGQSKAVKAAIAGYFRDPGAFASTQGDGVLPGGAAGLVEGPPVRSVIDPRTQAAIEEAMRQTARRIRAELGKGQDLKALRDQVEIQVTHEGLRIELIDSSKSMFFDSGSAVVKPETGRILALIARELTGLGKPVIIEGHTDGQPYARSDKYTNWELSADRANAARRVVVGAGVRPGQIWSVRGYADRRLRVPGDPRDPRNRRVSIVVPILTDTERVG